MIAPLPTREHGMQNVSPWEDRDNIVRLAAQVCGVSIAAIIFGDDYQRRLHSAIGLGSQKVLRGTTFYNAASCQSGLFVVPDARKDARFADHPLVIGDPCICFYASAPLVSQEGQTVGILCVIDPAPRVLTRKQREMLLLLGREAAKQLPVAARATEGETLALETKLLVAERAHTQNLLSQANTALALAQADLTKTEQRLRQLSTTTPGASDNILQQNEARLAEAQAVAQIGSWQFEAATKRITWSQEMFRLFGFAPSDGEPSHAELIRRFHPEDIPLFHAAFKQARRDGLPYVYDIRVPQPDGTLRWLHSLGRGEYNTHGKIVRLYGTCMDITERKQAEERYRVLFEWSSHAHFLFGETGIIDCNDATVALLGYKNKTQVLSLHPAVLSPEFQPDGRRSLEKCLEMDNLAREHGFHCFEWTHCKMDGTALPVEVTLTPVTLDNRPALLSVWHDLTERVRADEKRKLQEQTLRESEERHRLLVEGARDYAMVLMDVEGKITSWNAGAERLTGWHETDMLGQPLELLFTLSDREAGIPAQERGLAASETRATDLRWHVKKDGSVFYADGILEALQDDQGQLRGFAKVFRDATERRALEQEREQLAEANRLLLESTGEGIYGIDREGRFAFVNRAAAQMLGYAPEQLIGRCAHVLIHHTRPSGQFYPETECVIYQALQRSEGAHVEDDVFWHADGTSFPVAYTAAPILEQGKLCGAVVTFSDIRERKAVEWERERITERERNIATHLQAALQPAVPEHVPDFAVAAFTKPALDEAQVGGDFYDCFALDESTYALVIGDVSGKGLAAAQQLALVRNSLRTALYLQRRPARVAASINEMVTAHDLLVGFVTAFVGIYEAETGALSYASCGHEPGLVRRGDGSVIALSTSGPPLGMDRNAVYVEESYTLLPGDTLLLYTDGLTEAGPNRQSLLGTSGLTRIFEGISADDTVYSAAQLLLSQVASYADSAFRDDVTVLLARRNPI